MVSYEDVMGGRGEERGGERRVVERSEVGGCKRSAHAAAFREEQAKDDGPLSRCRQGCSACGCGRGKVCACRGGGDGAAGT